MKKTVDYQVGVDVCRPDASLRDQAGDRSAGIINTEMIIKVMRLDENA